MNKIRGRNFSTRSWYLPLPKWSQSLRIFTSFFNFKNINFWLFCNFNALNTRIWTPADLHNCLVRFSNVWEDYRNICISSENFEFSVFTRNRRRAVNHHAHIFTFVLNILIFVHESATQTISVDFRIAKSFQVGLKIRENVEASNILSKITST